MGLSVFGDARRDLASANLKLGDDPDDSGTHGQSTAMNDRGAIVYLPHLKTSVSTHLVRDFRDQLRKAELDNAGNVSWCATDAAGERVWRVRDMGSVVGERIYLGSYEVWRKRYGSGVLQEERQTLHNAREGAIYASAIVIRDSSAGTVLYKAIQRRAHGLTEPRESDGLDPLQRDAINSTESNVPNQLIQAAYRVQYRKKLGTIDTEDELRNVAAMLFTEGSYMIYVSEDPNLATFRRVNP